MVLLKISSEVEQRADNPWSLVRSQYLQPNHALGVMVTDAVVIRYQEGSLPSPSTNDCCTVV